MTGCSVCTCFDIIYKQRTSTKNNQLISASILLEEAVDLLESQIVIVAGTISQNLDDLIQGANIGS